MKALALIFAIAALMSVSSQAFEARPQGINCALKEPPAEAGEETNHGMVLRVFPRAKDIGAGYTGCQALMALYGGEWEVVLLTEVVAGDPVRVWSAHESDQRKLACRFNNGKLVRGDEKVCPAPEFLLLKSLPAGCVSVIREAIAKHGLGAPRPDDCDYD